MSNEVHANKFKKMLMQNLLLHIDGIIVKCS